MSAESMRRGAREANEESHAAAMGRAVGSLAAFITAINDLTKRVEALEKAQATAQPTGEAQDARRWQHVRRGGIYVVLAEGKMEADGTNVVIYKGESTGLVYVRPCSEFYDGRFVAIASQAAPGDET